MTADEPDREKVIQETQYDYPYHYIPDRDDDEFSHARYWSWGFRYLGGIDVVLDQINEEFDSLVDVGCGDGRFVRDVAKRYPNNEYLGVDYSERAIALANAMNPELDFTCLDITDEHSLGQFDIVTAIEVLEHIPPHKLDRFLDRLVELLDDDGMFILTVPHINMPVQPKHYQHFSSEQLHNVLSSYFRTIDIFPIDAHSKLLSALHKLVGGDGNHFVVTNRLVLTLFYNIYQKRYLYPDDERNCGRLAAVCHK